MCKETFYRNYLYILSELGMMLNSSGSIKGMKSLVQQTVGFFDRIDVQTKIKYFSFNSLAHWWIMGGQQTYLSIAEY